MKKVLKLTPVSPYDVRGTESWLEDMARRGLFLKRLRPTLSTFERGPACQVRYRLEPFRHADEVPQTMLDLYQDFGWEFICQVNSELLVFSTQDLDAPEPHSDPELQGELWRKLYRSKRRGLIVSLILDLVVAVCAGITLFQDGTPILNLLTTSALCSFAVLAALLYGLPQTWTDVKRLALIVQQLEEGVPLDHRTAYPRRRWSEAVYTALAILLLVLLIISQWILPFTGGDIRPLEDLTAFPALSLTELEGKEFEFRGYSQERYIDGELRTVNYSNFCKQNRYLLCRKWEVVQTGDIAPEGWRRLEINWYNLPGWLSPLSAPLARELLDSAMGLDQDIWWTGNSGAAWSVEYIPEAGFLAVASREDGGFHIAAAALGDKAVVVRYTGQGDLSEHLDEIMDMVRP